MFRTDDCIARTPQRECNQRYGRYVGMSIHVQGTHIVDVDHDNMEEDEVEQSILGMQSAMQPPNAPPPSTTPPLPPSDPLPATPPVNPGYPSTPLRASAVRGS